MNRKVTDTEIGYIKAHLQQYGVSDKNVLAELTDHLIILTESELTINSDFKTAFTAAFGKFKDKELLEISQNKVSYYAHPKFLNATFLTALGILSLLVFCFGIYLRFHELPGRKIFQVVGGMTFGYLFLPLMLLHWLTEYANKTKCIMLFMIMFTAFHSVIGLIYHWPILKWAVLTGFLFILLYISIFLIAPTAKKCRS